MAVIIDMDMPRSCGDCILCTCDGGGYYCEASATYVDINSTERDELCPLKSADDMSCGDKEFTR